MLLILKELPIHWRTHSQRFHRFGENWIASLEVYDQNFILTFYFDLNLVFSVKLVLHIVYLWSGSVSKGLVPKVKHILRYPSPLYTHTHTHPHAHSYTHMLYPLFKLALTVLHSLTSILHSENMLSSYIGGKLNSTVYKKDLWKPLKLCIEAALNQPYLCANTHMYTCNFNSKL